MLALSQLLLALMGCSPAPPTSVGETRTNGSAACTSKRGERNDSYGHMRFTDDASLVGFQYVPGERVRGNKTYDATIYPWSGEGGDEAVPMTLESDEDGFIEIELADLPTPARSWAIHIQRGNDPGFSMTLEPVTTEGTHLLCAGHVDAAGRELAPLDDYFEEPFEVRAWTWNGAAVEDLAVHFQVTRTRSNGFLLGTSTTELANAEALVQSDEASASLLLTTDSPDDDRWLDANVVDEFATLRDPLGEARERVQFGLWKREQVF